MEIIYHTLSISSPAGKRSANTVKERSDSCCFIEETTERSVCWKAVHMVRAHLVSGAGGPAWRGSRRVESGDTKVVRWELEWLRSDGKVFGGCELRTLYKIGPLVN